MLMAIAMLVSYIPFFIWICTEYFRQIEEDKKH